MEQQPIEAPMAPESLTFEQATSWEDLKGAYGLLYRAYLAKNFLQPTAIGLRYTHFNLLPSSATFVAKLHDRVIGTLSVIIDSRAFGLPMEPLYSTELEHLRGSGHSLGEGSGLAIDPLYQDISRHIVLCLVKMATLYGRRLGVTYSVIACHPRHAAFYKRLFRYREIGPLRSYNAVNNAPAVAMGLDLRKLEATYLDASRGENTGIYKFFFTDEGFCCPPSTLVQCQPGSEVARKLCALQPSVMVTLEEHAPGIVRQITGQDVFERACPEKRQFWRATQAAVPAFIPT